MPDINAILKYPCHKGFNQYGSSMGRRDQREGTPERLHLQQLRMSGGAAYDAGGAYWGMGNPMWCAFSPDNTQNEEPVMVFVRAASRQEAKELVLERLAGDGWSFYR